MTISRRIFLQSSGLAAAAAATNAQAASASPGAAEASTVMRVTLKVNGASHVAELEPRVTLLDYLHDRLGLTGARKGCNEGACGTCTVLVEGLRMNACLTLAVQCADKEVTTVEGIARGSTLHLMQQAFRSSHLRAWTRRSTSSARRGVGAFRSRSCISPRKKRGGSSADIRSSMKPSSSRNSGRGS